MPATTPFLSSLLSTRRRDFPHSPSLFPLLRRFLSFSGETHLSPTA
ncbi:hypothetical protein OIU84_017435 [Salix udensis]|uniref:Uncharacterized protein n=1 Tax=Salix udensis TaxID=889485 RepID=A0AAD6L431_9ROSI|nr:hypothetical protein OIU84_017435 [Salix udensis]